MKRKHPKFLRQEGHRFKRLGEKWRRPRGKDSKMRIGKRGKPALVSVGYRQAKEVRGLHPSGLREVLVHNPKEVEGINPRVEAIRIASGVGRKKRELILSRAQELGLRVLNPRGEARGAKGTEKVGS